jgi:hypothetical protein
MPTTVTRFQRPNEEFVPSSNMAQRMCGRFMPRSRDIIQSYRKE